MSSGDQLPPQTPPSGPQDDPIPPFADPTDPPNLVNIDPNAEANAHSSDDSADTDDDCCSDEDEWSSDNSEKRADRQRREASRQAFFDDIQRRLNDFSWTPWQPPITERRADFVNEVLTDLVAIDSVEKDIEAEVVQVMDSLQQWQVTRQALERDEYPRKFWATDGEGAGAVISSSSSSAMPISSSDPDPPPSFISLPPEILLLISRHLLHESGLAPATYHQSLSNLGLVCKDVSRISSEILWETVMLFARDEDLDSNELPKWKVGLLPENRKCLIKCVSSTQGLSPKIADD